MFTYWCPSDDPVGEELALRTEAIKRYGAVGCPTFWGSHGCDKAWGHVQGGDIVHRCGNDIEDGYDPDYVGGLCTEMITLGPETDTTPMNNAAVRYYYGDGEWSEWGISGWFS